MFCQVIRYKKVRSCIFISILVFVVANIFLLMIISTFQLSSEFKTVSQSVFQTHPRAVNPDLNVDETASFPKYRVRNLPTQQQSQAPGNTSHTTRPLETVQISQKAVKDRPSVDSQILGNVCETWCHRGEHMSPPYNLTAVLLVRIYRHDLAGLSSREMLQWLYYLRYAGFEHVFVYDAYVSKNESQYHVLAPLVQSGYVTYVDWSGHNPYTIQGTQIAAYQECVDQYGKLTKWHTAIDIDEYPFSPIDLEQNFMQRFLRDYSQKYPDISEITLNNFLFLGKPLDHLSNPLLIDRFRRRTHKPANKLGKSVFKTADVRQAQVHHNDMRSGKSVDCDSRVMRMNHYWGARLQNWGEDTARVLKMTEVDFSIKPIIDEMNHCSQYLGENHLYLRRWN